VFERLGQVLAALFGGKPIPGQPQQPETPPPAPVAPVVVPVVVEPAPAPEPKKPLTTKQKTTRAGIAIAAACATAVPLTQTKEGLALKPYKDPAAIVTWCYGETDGKPLAIYTKSQCGDMLRERMGRDYAPKLLAPSCLPQLIDPARRNEFAALIDASYNAGPVAVCKSPMVIRMRADDWVAGCKAFEGWYTTARNRQTGQRIQLRGLVIRRQDEMRLCLRPE
jgi:lysozyme